MVVIVHGKASQLEQTVESELAAGVGKEQRLASVSRAAWQGWPPNHSSSSALPFCSHFKSQYQLLATTPLAQGFQGSEVADLAQILYDITELHVP